MSVEQGLRAVGASASKAKALAPGASAAMVAGGITTNDRARYFLAQLGHESCGFFYVEELASGADYENRTDLGNTHPGDGRRYKGRGWIQVTGRSNYRSAGTALGLPLENNPSLAADPDIAWRVAVWYWNTRSLNSYCDRQDFLGLTKRINGGTNGLEDRKRRLANLDGIDCRPVVKKVRPIKLTETEKKHVNNLRSQRRIAKRHGGWGKIDFSHRKSAEASVLWLRTHATALAESKVKDTEYRDRKAEFLRDVAFNRNGRGM
jgi:predicted chitinase